MSTQPDPFDDVARLLEGPPVAATTDRLLERLRDPSLLPYLFEVLNMRGRRARGLHMQIDGRARQGRDEPPPDEQPYFVEACALVGDEFVRAGDLGAAWPYYRAAGLHDRMREAIERWRHSGGPEDLAAAQRLEGVIQVAFYEGVHPVRGYELVLAQRGTCDGISVFERQFPHSHELREECGVRLVRQMLREVQAGVRRAIELEQGEPASDLPLAELLEGRPWLFKRGRPHVDDSHLASVIRIASTLERPEAHSIAIELCDYGTQLGVSAQRVDQAPFDDFYRDYRLFLSALLERDVDLAVEHFTRKAEAAGPGKDGNWFAAQILVLLLARVRRYSAAAAAYLRFLRDARQVKVAPSLIRLCELAGDPTSLVEFARARKDLVHLCAAHLIASAPWNRAAPAARRAGEVSSG